MNQSITNRRLPAEWEPQRIVQFTFPHRHSDWAYMLAEVTDCFVQMINTTANYVPVVVVCDAEASIPNYFTRETKFPILFVNQASNDTWARDHGAITILEDHEPVLLDFAFNGWGKKFDAEKDNLISSGLAAQGFFKDELRSTDFVLEGGAIESDGNGTLLTTTECLLSPHRNPTMEKEKIESFLKETFGLHQVLWLDHGYLAGDDTDSHIDTLARLCNSNTIAYVKCDDLQDEHYPALQQMEQQLMTFKTLEGQPYQLIPLPWPAACFDKEGHRLPATYANFLITNGAVLVPTYNLPTDQSAIEILQKCFPDREVIGVNCRPLIEQHGSLHCVTMQYPEEINISWL